MRPRLLLAHVPMLGVTLLGVAMLWVPTLASAQAAPAVEAAPSTEEAAPAETPAVEPEAEAVAEPEITAPDEEPAGGGEVNLNVAPSETGAAAETATDAAELTLEGVGAEQTSESEPEDWTQPIPVLTLHGYMRVRGEIQDTFWLGRGIDSGTTFGDPFTPYRASENVACLETASASTCDGNVETLAYANMRLRLSPQLNLSDDVRVNMTFDALDNVIAGSGPSSFYGPTLGRTYASTLEAGTVVVRRAWAEVRNRNLGELRFGRMPAHWGLGMVQNAGNGIDDDRSTEVDRVMVITKLAGFYLTAAYDYAGEGATRPGPSGLTLDASQRDDVDQLSFSVSHRLSPEEQEDAIARGDLMYQAGGMFNYRVQDLAARSELLPPSTGIEPDGSAPADLLNVNAVSYNFDAWGQLKYRGLRVEAEAALVVGSVQDTLSDGAGAQRTLLQFGSTLETELRLLDDKLGIYFYAGIASGDPEANGLSSDVDYAGQNGSGDGTISTFRFHPTYRVDLILWRNLMQQVTGAYYFKPGISYDFARDPFGQLLGARIDAIWSRAVFSGQTWGNDPNLGVELNASLYWRGEDGPEIDDGFHAMLQYGLLLPMQGLWYGPKFKPTEGGPIQGANGELKTAQTLRLVLGVVY